MLNLKTKRNKIIFSLILAVFVLVGLIPVIAYWVPKDTILFFLKGIAIVVGASILFLIYRKYPGIALITIPVSIVVGTVYKWHIMEYVYEVSLSEILIVALGLIFLFDKFLKRDFKFKLYPVGFFFLLYIALCIVSFLWVQSIPKYLITTRMFLYYFAVFFLVINTIEDIRDFRYGLWGVPLCGLAVSAQLTWKVYKLGGFITYAVPERTQIITQVGSWVFIAAIIILCVPLTYTLGLVSKKIWQKIILFGSTIFISVASLFPLGKGAVLSLFLGMTYLGTRLKQKRIVTIFIALAIILVIAVPMVTFTGAFIERMKNTFRDPNVQYRIIEYSTGSKIFSENLLFGVGAGNLKVMYKERLPHRVETDSNNFILQTAVETGVIGLVILFLIMRSIVYSLVSIRKKISKSVQQNSHQILFFGFIATLIIAFVHGMIEATFVGLNYGIVFWYILGLLIVWQDLLKRTKS